MKRSLLFYWRIHACFAWREERNRSTSTPNYLRRRDETKESNIKDCYRLNGRHFFSKCCQPLLDFFWCSAIGTTLTTASRQRDWNDIWSVCLSTRLLYEKRGKRNWATWCLEGLQRPNDLIRSRLSPKSRHFQWHVDAEPLWSRVTVSIVSDTATIFSFDNDVWLESKKKCRRRHQNKDRDEWCVLLSPFHSFKTKTSFKWPVFRLDATVCLVEMARPSIDNEGSSLLFHDRETEKPRNLLSAPISMPLLVAFLSVERMWPK